ncbi:MAG TPA: translation elongation factor 4 [Kiritimatiellia bacterium]|jgi:GTP-binding protein LepA|nr:translation elongation factor 4 [Kiritimatiellia bacterium]HOU57966.1 translation elongation factor 4 [Kiritimatiellia bacterium]HQF19711.1 translation elongation factor 4 [Kiritimatiellia bacterium]HQG73683.1 translation elongation factor 4 [Kiritimatiellia bacterium]HQK44200.1 translation elongation factor 4 [Kiritimatiellia bacterium]
MKFYKENSEANPEQPPAPTPGPAHDLTLIRNFSIIAHIDHGKTTLSDRLLELTGAVTKREQRDQLLDDMDLERERGITIKAHPVTMKYIARDGRVYEFNFIDTPGHVDFSYEVSRSLAACEGALLVVDTTQGVEAQTVAHAFLAAASHIKIIPVLNKTDMPAAESEVVARQIEDMFAIPREECFHISAKTGVGVAEVLEALVERIPPPVSKYPGDLRALVFDSEYNTFRGGIIYVRVFDGAIRRGDRIRLMGSGKNYEVQEVGIFNPRPQPVDVLQAGQVGYFLANIKNTAEIMIGDTVTGARTPTEHPLPGFKAMHPMVFTGLYPVDADDYEKLKFSLEKLALNDSSFHYQTESSVALGFGFRCGFLGLLHMEIVQERLRREYDCDIIATYPGVVYRVRMNDGAVREVDNPVFLPDPTEFEAIEEPIVKLYLICLGEQIGDMMKLVMDKRGLIERTESLDTKRVMLTCIIPLNEILIDFHDRLKSISRGYASMDYEPAGYREDDLVKLDILVHGEPVEAFSCIVHRDKAEARGRQICEVLVDLIPPQQFAIAIQAALGAKIIARTTVRPYRKDVTAKCYGGDITRKRKLLEKQKEGKKRMKQFGKVGIPQEAFIAVLKSKQ